MASTSTSRPASRSRSCASPRSRRSVRSFSSCARWAMVSAMRRSASRRASSRIALAVLPRLAAGPGRLGVGLVRDLGVVRVGLGRLVLGVGVGTAHGHVGVVLGPGPDLVGGVAGHQQQPGRLLAQELGHGRLVDAGAGPRLGLGHALAVLAVERLQAGDLGADGAGEGLHLHGVEPPTHDREVGASHLVGRGGVEEPRGDAHVATLCQFQQPRKRRSGTGRPPTSGPVRILPRTVAVPAPPAVASSNAPAHTRGRRGYRRERCPARPADAVERVGNDADRSGDDRPGPHRRRGRRQADPGGVERDHRRARRRSGRPQGREPPEHRVVQDPRRAVEAGRPRRRRDPGRRRRQRRQPRAGGGASPPATAGVPCEIFVPEGASISKTEATRSYGATVCQTGETVDAAVAARQARAAEAGMAFIHPFDDLAIVAGQATLGLELVEDVAGPAPGHRPGRRRWAGRGVAIALKRADPGHHGRRRAGGRLRALRQPAGGRRADHHPGRRHRRQAARAAHPAAGRALGGRHRDRRTRTTWPTP